MGSHHKMHYFFILLSGMAFMLSSTTAYATPNILGTYEGTVTSTDFNCGIGLPDGSDPSSDGHTAWIVAGHRWT